MVESARLLEQERWKLFYSWGGRPALPPPWERDWLNPEAKEAEETKSGSPSKFSDPHCEQWKQSERKQR